MKGKILIGSVVAAVLAGCATTPQSLPDRVDFLQDGVTSKQDVLLKLGQPSGKFDGEKILTYRVAKDEAGYFLHECPARTASHDWPVWGHEHSLVLVFDEQDVLRKFSVVDMMRKEPK